MKLNELMQTVLAKDMGKSQSYIANKLRLFKLEPEVQSYLAFSTITARHGRTMLGLTSVKQSHILHEVLQKKLSVKEAGAICKNVDDHFAKKAEKVKKAIQKELEKKRIVETAKDLKVRVNTIKQAVKSAKDSGIEIKSHEEKIDDGYRITIELHRKQGMQLVVDTIPIVNQKGGVGRTTTTISLAIGTTNRGYHVLIIDIDPQENAASGLGVERSTVHQDIYNVLVDEVPITDVTHHTNAPNLDITLATINLSSAGIELISMMVGETRLKSALGQMVDDYDSAFINYSLSLGQLSVNAFTASDSILIPVQSEYYAMEGLSQLPNAIRLVQRHFNKDLDVEGVLLTMPDARTNLGAEAVREVQSYFNKKVYKTVIPRITELAGAPSYGEPVTGYGPKSRGAKLYDDLAREVLKAYGKRLRK